MLYSKTLLFDQITPITIFKKLEEYFKDELSFLLESAINSEEGNYSFLFIGARERVVFKNDLAVHTDEDGNTHELGSNPF